MSVEVIMAVGESRSAVRSFIDINFNGEVTGKYSGCYATYF